MRETVNSVVNLLTYMALGVMLILFGISMYNIASPYEMLIFFGAFFGLLLLGVVIGYTGNRAFPNFEMERYRIFFFCVETVAIIMIACIGIGLRLEAIEKIGILYDKWGYYENGKLVLSSYIVPLPDKIRAMFIFNPAYFFYSLISALSIYIADVGETTILYLQLILQFLFAFFAYRVARKVSGRLAGLITFAILMCMPSLVSSVGVVFDNLPGLVIVFAQIWIFYALQKRRHTELKLIIKILYYFLDGLLLGIAVFAMPETIAVFVGEIIYILLLNRHSKKHIVSFISLFVSTIIGAFIAVCAKCVYLGINLNLALHGYISYLSNGGTDGITGNMRFCANNLAVAFSVDNYADKVMLHNLPMENATIYGNLILMSVCCLIFLWMLGERVYFVLNLYFLTMFTYGAVFSHENIYHINIMPYLAILTGVLFEKIYVSFKVEPKRISKMVKQLSEIAIKTKETEIIDLDVNSEIIEEIVAEEKSENIEEVASEEKSEIAEEVPTLEKLLGEEKAKKNEPSSNEENDIKPLDNPLPVPKKHEKEDLDYDIEVSDDADFDL